MNIPLELLAKILLIKKRVFEKNQKALTEKTIHQAMSEASISASKAAKKFYELIKNVYLMELIKNQKPSLVEICERITIKRKEAIQNLISLYQSYPMPTPSLNSIIQEIDDFIQFEQSSDIKFDLSNIDYQKFLDEKESELKKSTALYFRSSYRWF